jgi:hypothetical protein
MREGTAPLFRLLFSQTESVRAKQVYDLVTTYIRAGENTIGKNTYFLTKEEGIQRFWCIRIIFFYCTGLPMQTAQVFRLCARTILSGLL